MDSRTPQKYYIGLATNFHDPTIALVDDEGRIVFAQATERYLQSKRGLSSACDPVFYVEEILKRYPVSDYEIANNWTYYSGLYKFMRSAGIVYTIKHYIKFTKWFIRFRKFKPENELAGSIDFAFTSHFSCVTIGGSTMRHLLTFNQDLTYKRISSFDHHLCHAYQAFYSSPFEDALVLVLDGTGDESSSYSLYDVKKREFTRLFRNGPGPSLGDFYGAITHLCGFSDLKAEEWKVMGMAPYGKKHDELYADLKKWIDLEGTSLIQKDKKQFLRLREKKLKNEYVGLTRYDIAYTGQLLYEEMVSQLLNAIYKKWPHKNLILTGGCALNSAYNGKIHVETPFKNVYIPSSPGDDGCAVGAALLNFKKHNPEKLIPYHQHNSYLGFEINEEEILFMANYSGYIYKKSDYTTLYSEVAKELQNGKIIAWVQGKAEFGPRALGNRSILANPSLADMKDKINANVKFREEFRPFAPSVLEEKANEYFKNYRPTPYMERVLTIKENKRGELKAVNHIDNTGRLQTVSKENNEHFYNLITEFYKLTNVPVLLNTSFNVMGKPIVNSVTDMAAVFATSGIDVLVINDYIFRKKSDS
jgi:carbamoyltransferase